MNTNLFDSAVYHQSLFATEHTSTKYYKLTNFGFLRLSTNEKYPDTFYPTPNDKVPAGWFSLDIHNSTTGDFNGDGLQDLILMPMIFPHLIPHYETTLSPIYLIQKDNNIIDPIQVDTKSQFFNQHFLYRLASADFNNDGLMDVVASGMQPFSKENATTLYNTNDLPSVFWGSNTNNFQSTKQFKELKVMDATINQFGYKVGHSIAVGDFNGDGNKDFVSDHWLFTNDGGNSMSFTPTFLTYLKDGDKWQYPNINSIVADDFNNDGFCDIVFSNMPQNDDGRYNGGDLLLMYGSATGLKDGGSTIQLARQNNTKGNIGTNFMVSIDANGDGKKDIVLLEHDWTGENGDSTYYYSNGRLRLFLGNNDGSFNEASDRIIDAFAGTRMGEGNIHTLDVNGDGWQDIVLSGYESGKTTWADNIVGSGTSVFLNNKGILQLVDSTNIPYLANYQIDGYEKYREWHDKPSAKMLPIDIGNDGMLDFVGFVDTPLLNWPQTEAVHKIGYIVRAQSPLGRDTKNEYLIGTESSDKIFGYDGNDIIEGRKGNDSINGGEGIDIAKYSGIKTNYNITIQDGIVTISNKQIVDEGLDQLEGVERLKFSDCVLALDLNGNAGQAYRLYKAALDRTPDSNGLAGWIKYMDDGAALPSMSQQFIDSQEFKTKYGALDNTGFVNQLYINVLARKGETTGVEGWVNGLANGLSRAQVLTGFSESNENQANVIGQIKNGIPYNEWWLTN